ncbi:unnamed protein product [Oncorhynchus mykiss]|uniref:Uncharacterized protein n=1 Tax=Oncorhynchus mykiss TaxID=8022 RepID=A0A060WCN7_ONCMY|nr:unnamed protein product [Oncorhynchus mykiss]
MGEVGVTTKLCCLTHHPCPPLAPNTLILLLTYLSDLLPYQPTRALRSTTAGHLVIPRSKLQSFSDKAFSRVAPRLWNSLPPAIRDSESITIFQSLLKLHLFDKAYP